MMTENSSITKSHTFFATLGIALSVGLAPAKTHAATTFGFDESLSGLSSFILKADGITLTVSNLNSNAGASEADSDGLWHRRRQPRLLRPPILTLPNLRKASTLSILFYRIQ